ncbi:MAG: MBL fold metallo-hydrolase [Pseudomonadota bacterium]
MVRDLPNTETDDLDAVALLLLAEALTAEALCTCQQLALHSALVPRPGKTESAALKDLHRSAEDCPPSCCVRSSRHNQAIGTLVQATLASEGRPAPLDIQAAVVAGLSARQIRSIVDVSAIKVLAESVRDDRAETDRIPCMESSPSRRVVRRPADYQSLQTSLPQSASRKPLSRRTLLSGSLAALAAPYVHGIAVAETSAAGPIGATAGPISLDGHLTGYTVDSIRNHSINAYWVSGPDGVLAIDAYWRIPEAQEALSAFESVTGRRRDDVAGIAITHPHSDHYGGLTTMSQAVGGAPALASDTGARVIAQDEHGFWANRREDIPNDIPVEIPVVTSGLRDGEALEIGGVVAVPRLLRGNEAIETAVIYLPEQRTLVTGDLVGNRTTPVFYQGQLASWEAQLLKLRSMFPEAETIAPGHGAPGEFDELVAEEVRYLTTWRGLMEEALVAGGGGIGTAEARRVRDGIVDAFPDWRTSAGVPERDRLIALNIGWTLDGWRIPRSGENAIGPRAFRNGD